MTAAAKLIELLGSYGISACMLCHRLAPSFLMHTEWKHLPKSRALRAVLGCWMLAVGLCFSAVLTPSAQATPTVITEFPVNFGHPSNLEDVFVSPDGSVWFTDRWQSEELRHPSIGYMDSEGNLQEFEEGLPEYAFPHDLVAGPDGNIWFAGGGTLDANAGVGKITPEGNITEYTYNLDGSVPEDIAFGSDGNLWYTGFLNPAIGFVTLDGEITDFPLSGQPWYLVEGPDGNIWFTYGGNGHAPAIGRLKHSPGGTTVITFFSLNAVSQPDKITASPNGYLWFLDQSKALPAIGRVSVTGVVKEFRTGLSPETRLQDLAAGPEGNVWFTDPGSGAVGRVSPAGQITEFGNSGKNPETRKPLDITAGPDGNMWFTDSGRIGKVSPSGTITMLHQGLGPSSFPHNIISGPGPYLSFLTSEGLSSSIGRILPGDDDSSPPQQVEAPPSTPRFGRLVLQSKKARVSHTGRAHLRFSCQRSIACTGQLHLYVERRAGAAGTVISLASFSIAARTAARVGFKLNPMGRRLLRANSRMQVHLYLSSDSGPVLRPTTFLLIQPSGHRTRP